MKVTLLTSLRIIACYSIYANADPLPKPSATPALPSTPGNHDALKPITFGVAANGIVKPTERGPRNSDHPANSHRDDLEIFPVIGTEQEAPIVAAHSLGVQEDALVSDTSTEIEHLSGRHHHKHNPFRAGGLHLGHGPVVQGARPIISGGGLSTTPFAAHSQPDYNEPSTRYLVIPLSQNDRILKHAGISASEVVQPNKETPSTHSNSEDSDIKHASSKPTSSQMAEESTNKPASSKSPNISTDSGSLPTGILPTISRCLNILQPLRDLAERLVYIKEAPHHTLMSACHFKSHNRTHYDGWHVEGMRELCWDLFETIQLEGRRRWERCVGKQEDKYQYNSNTWKEGDPIYEHESGVDKFTFHAYQLTPGKVKEFIAEHPDLSSEDIEWLTNDTSSTATATSTLINKMSVFRAFKRSWISDLFKSIFVAEVDTTIKHIGTGVGGIVTEEVQDYRQKSHARNRTSKAQKVSSHNNSTSSTHSKRDPQSNRVYVHGQWRPIGPVNKYVNQARADIGLPYSSKDIDNYLKFVRETRRLSSKQYRRLRVAVERELKLNSRLLSTPESKHNLQSDDIPDKQQRHTDYPATQKRSGQPPKLNSNFKHPYQWNIPSDLTSNPAYINLTLAWNNTVSIEHKAWIGLQLRNVWVLRAGDLCNISRSWTKDLSEESQEIELKFKGLNLQRCKEILEGTRENSRVGEYWKDLSKEEYASNRPFTRDPTLDGHPL